MRRGLTTAVTIAVLVATAHALATQPAGAQQAGSSSGGVDAGVDQQAEGSLLGGGGGAEVGASFETTAGGELPTGASPAPSGRGRASNSPIRCSLWPIGVAPNPEIPTTESLESLWARRAPGTTSLEVMRVCYDEGGNIVSADESTWAPSAGGDPPPLIDPAFLAATARSRLAFPPPVPRTSPGLDTGTYAQLSTAFWVEGWQDASSSATAGPVTATVTARPVSQEWQIRDALRGDSESVVCEGPGRPPAGGEPGVCSWTPRHSSAGQSGRGGLGNEPCFPATVTVTWGVAWRANVPGAGGSLGEGTSSTDTCLVVAEIQAVVSETG
jgi:hypothetical protein